MKNIMKGLKKKSGFTLIEMIVVIGIIGVLAGILIPTFRGYVLSANKANDKVMAKKLYDTAKITMIQDWDAWNSFYSYNTSRMRVSEAGYNPADEWSDRNYTPYSDGIYEIVFNHKLDGSVPLKDDGGYKVISGSMETKYFAGMMNKGLIHRDDPAMLAFAYTAPISALIHLCDREPDKVDEALAKVDAFSRHFIRTYGVIDNA